MLERIFWAATITIPLYLSIALESASISGQFNHQIFQQPQHLLAHLKEKFSEFQPEFQESPASSVRSTFGDR
jgi:hypothetical protein